MVGIDATGKSGRNCGIRRKRFCDDAEPSQRVTVRYIQRLFQVAAPLQYNRRLIRIVKTHIHIAAILNAIGSSASVDHWRIRITSINTRVDNAWLAWMLFEMKVTFYGIEEKWIVTNHSIAPIKRTTALNVYGGLSTVDIREIDVYGGGIPRAKNTALRSSGSCIQPEYSI